MHFKIATYRVLQERSNQTASFAEYLKFQDYMTFTYAPSAKSGKLKQKKIEYEHFTFWKYYMQGAPQKNLYHCFFRGAPTISRTNHFDTNILGKFWETKIK